MNIKEDKPKTDEPFYALVVLDSTIFDAISHKLVEEMATTLVISTGDHRYSPSYYTLISKNTYDPMLAAKLAFLKDITNIPIHRILSILLSIVSFNPDAKILINKIVSLVQMTNEEQSYYCNKVTLAPGAD
jgi:hypothetical protein